MTAPPVVRRPPSPPAGFSPWLQRQWWRRPPTLGARLLLPLAAVYAALAAWQRRRARPQRAPVPVVVVGNLIAGGAGKTPVVIALVQALRQAGRRPGVVSRGYGRRVDPGDAVRAVRAGDDPAVSGDEPLLVARRCGVPVFVGVDRVAAARALCATHPGIDVIVADDGLQHHALARDAEIVVFDERGAGNGWLLPAGPLREPLPERLPPGRRVVYTAAAPSTPLPGVVVARALSAAWPLDAWARGDRDAAVPLDALRGRTLVAVAGIAAPEKFHAMLEAAGLSIERLPMPDHHAYATVPWAPATAEVVVTEKDAVKLARRPALRDGTTRVWVVPLDSTLPDAFVDELLERLALPPT